MSTESLADALGRFAARHSISPRSPAGRALATVGHEPGPVPRAAPGRCRVERGAGHGGIHRGGAADAGRAHVAGYAATRVA